MNKNFTIPAFAEPITDLPDTPTLTAAELKRRFQAPADEVREAHNALAECVEGITSATYPDTVTEDMLTDELMDKINGKVDQTALDSQIAALEAEKTARANADSSLRTQISAKCEIVIGTYTGTGGGQTQTISLGFRPKAVLVANARWGGNTFDPQMMNLAVSGADADNIAIVSNGFQAKSHLNLTDSENISGNPYRYIAFK